jgi:16S rRNA (uracil1498-N3)-methyltransferase
MDWLVEKATELGAARLTPLSAERSVLKLQGERAEKKRAHWQAVAVAASEQSGRNRVMQIDPACSLAASLASLGDASGLRLVLSLTKGAQPLTSVVANHSEVMVLSGPEGGLTAAEEALALAAGFVPVSLGARVLRAETAPLAVLAALTL